MTRYIWGHWQTFSRAKEETYKGDITQRVEYWNLCLRYVLQTPLASLTAQPCLCSVAEGGCSRKQVVLKDLYYSVDVVVCVTVGIY